MALDVDWAGSDATNPHRIFVPRADMPIVQASPEVRELNVDQFRQSLRTIEADVEGAPWPETHRHQTETVLSGTTFARIVEILDPYVVEFEDGQYSVRATGANHNILDVKVNNQVSLAVFLSSGLINSPDIQYSSFGGAVLVDPTNTTGLAQSGTVHPSGTRRRPVDNFPDALEIAASFGLNTIHVLGGTSVSPIQIDTVDLSGFVVYGDSDTATFVEVLASAQVLRSEWRDMTIEGEFDGDVHFDRCVVGDVNMVEGAMQDCRLRGIIMLSGTGQFTMLSCVDDIAGAGTPVIDWNGADIEVIVRGYRGGLACRNRTNAKGVSIDGTLRLVLESTFAGTGNILVRGIGPKPEVQNPSPAFTLVDQMVDIEGIYGLSGAILGNVV